MVLGISRVIFLLVFDIHFSLFHKSSSPPPPHVAGDMAMAFVDDLFLLGLPLIFVPYFASFVALPFRGVGVGFEDPHLRLMF